MVLKKRKTAEKTVIFESINELDIKLPGLDIKLRDQNEKYIPNILPSIDVYIIHI